ncbi:MAG: UDP-N-acetylmuramoyl-tripeptide--D-alanyl-D-alanine ligase [candidate division WOR-3 bacterium]|nr:UDP-N-acetylmuramoyl-tripeptide--D-alanyl-D-alanine ligase [candidate division WOR-3 bacterium]
MKKIKLEKIIEVLNGMEVEIKKYKNKMVKGISIDSRAIKDGELFFALKGKKFDGHDFVGEAIKKSHLPAVVQEKVRNEGLILVEDTLKSLGKLASYYREIIDPFIIAITGSYGKTTTKEFLGAIFQTTAPTLVSFKNYNTLIGVPLNIFRFEDEEVAILELASNRKGEIKSLSEIVKPDVGLITGIGRSHLEAFGDEKGVLQEKKDIMSTLRGPLFINGDDELLRSIERDNLITIGFKDNNDYSFKLLQESIDGSIFGINGKEFWIRLPTLGMTRCALFATAIALHRGISSEAIQKGLKSVESIPHRMQIKRVQGITIIDDTYNSNPDSLLNVIPILERMPGRKLAVLGPMLELGKKSDELHRKAGEKLQGKIDDLIVIGEKAKGFLETFGRGHLVSNKKEGFEKVKELIRRGDVILFKSSRFLQLETLVKRLEDECSISYIP